MFVAKNGDDLTADGSVSKPFLTVQAAMEYAWNVYVLPIGPQPAPPFTRPCVFVNAGTYDDGDLVLPPQVCIMGEGYNHSRIKGNWTIDARWSNYVPPSLPSPPSVLVPNDFRSSWNNVGLFGNIDINFDNNFSNEGKLYAFGCRFAGNLNILEKLPNPVSNQQVWIACEFLANVTLTGIPTLMTGCTMRGGTLTLNQAISDSADNTFESSGGSFANIVINTSTGLPVPPYTCTLAHSVQPGATLTLNGDKSLVHATQAALPLQSLITLAGGATLAQIDRVNQPNFAGPAAARPASPYVGQQWFDTSILPPRPIWWDGTQWIDAAGGGV